MKKEEYKEYLQSKIKEVKETLEKLRGALKIAEIDEDKDNIKTTIDTLESELESYEKSFDMSDETSEWFDKREKHLEACGKWKEDVKYDNNMNKDYINKTIEKVLGACKDKWLEIYGTDALINKEELKKSVDSIEFELPYPEGTTVNIELREGTVGLTGKVEHYVSIQYEMKNEKLNYSLPDNMRYELGNIINGSRYDFFLED